MMSFCQLFRPAPRLHPPFGYESVGRQKSLQRRIRDSVLVDVVTPRDRSEPFKIEICVLDFQRIECPLHQLIAMGDGIVALEELDLASEPGIAMRLFHRHHVRVQVKMSVATSGNGERVTDKRLALPRANNLSANLGSQREDAQGHQLCIAEAP